jgi:hypothetical protein
MLGICAFIESDNKVESWGISTTHILIASLALIALITLSRYLIFGFPFPNTFYAKSGLGIERRLTESMRYIYRFFRDNPFYLLAFPASVYFARDKFASNRYGKILVASFLWMLLLFPLLTGPDHFMGYRFYIPYLPMLTLVSLYWLYLMLEKATIKRYNYFGYAVAAILLVSGRPMLDMVEGNPHLKLSLSLPDSNKQLIQDIKLTFRELSPSIGTLTAGEPRYSYNGYILDLVGLNHVTMAHSDEPRDSAPLGHLAFDPDIFLDICPDLLLPYSHDIDATSTARQLPHGFLDDFEKKALKGLDSDPRFLSLYSPYSIIRKGEWVEITGWMRDNFIDSIDKSEYEIKRF